MSIPGWISRREPKLVPIGPAVWQLPKTFESVTHLNPPKWPWVIVGRNVFSLCPFPDKSADVYHIWCQSVQLPQTFILWPPTTPMPLGVLRGDLNLAYVHSQMNPQTWTKVGANRSNRLTASPDVWMFDPLTPKCPLVYRGAICLAYIHSRWIWEFAHVCQIWCQSAQPFDIFSRICAKVSSALRRCTRWLAQKHAKKQHLYIENHNSGPTMQTSTSLTLFTAIFVAFSGALADELTILCRHVRTELYIYILAGLPGFAGDHCSIIIYISAFYF